MAVVRVEPLGVDVEVRPDQTLMEAAEARGLRWPTTCHGSAICTRCVVEVPEAHRDAFRPMRPDERDALERVRWRGEPRAGERLACQVRVVQDAVVHKQYVRWARGEETA